MINAILRRRVEAVTSAARRLPETCCSNSLTALGGSLGNTTVIMPQISSARQSGAATHRCHSDRRTSCGSAWLWPFFVDVGGGGGDGNDDDCNDDANEDDNDDDERSCAQADRTQQRETTNQCGEICQRPENKWCMRKCVCMRSLVLGAVAGANRIGWTTTPQL